jgi:hypothetical protein
MRIYRTSGRNLSWTKLIVAELLRARKPAMAMAVLADRVSCEDTKGVASRLLSEVITELASSPAARRVAGRHAARAPGSGIDLAARAMALAADMAAGE